MKKEKSTIIDENGIENPTRSDDGDVKPRKFTKAWIAFLALGILFLLGGVASLLVAILLPKDEADAVSFPEIPSRVETTEEVYSALTGEVLASAENLQAPAYCVQIPNGLDGARPQVGLTEAGVIFEAIAETGITRFAAIFQNPSSAVIGPIRSLRLYYLEWDTPFDCTIVHAGGATDALVAVRNGGYRDLTEHYAYMYRGNAGARRWNNLFTTAASLARFNADAGFKTSEIKGFARMTPDKAKKEQVDGLVANRLDIVKAAEGDTSAMTAEAPSVTMRFGGIPSFNVHYDYDMATNRYLRSYASGEAHKVYQCPNENLGEVNPEGVCELVQLAPAVVIAMVVDEWKASDGYHEAIATTGIGEAYIFQNGKAIRGSWEKASRDEQIKFFETSGAEVKLVPGQTIISAIPKYGGVDY